MAAVTRLCPSCGADVRAEFAYCGLCGSEVRVQSPVGSAVRAGDRRTVTVLFADLSGFTRLGRELDPEDLKVCLNECLGELLDEVVARDGWLEKQIGDAILAIFGAPSAHEDDPARAVRAALAMRERMHAINERLGPRLGRTLEVHMGVNTGLVVMGPGIGRDRDGEFIVIGDTVNTGARLQQAAKPSQILVGEATYAATSAQFEYRRLPPVAGKHGEERVAAYECVGERPAAETRGGARAATSPLIGRTHELAAIATAVEGATGSRGAIVAVVGEAGLGKSRLLAEVRQVVGDERVAWLEGRGTAVGRTISHEPFRNIIRQDAGIGPTEDESEEFAKLEARVRALLPDAVGDVLPYLATLLGLPVPGEYAQRVKYLDAESLGAQIFRASRRWLERLARERPLVLAFEDWHWADESSAELLEHVVGLAETAPVVFCFACRPDADTPAARLRALAAEHHADRYLEIVLAPLSPRETEQLALHLLNSPSLPARLRSLVLQKSEGNPFFLEEIVRALIDLGAIVRDEEGRGWRLEREAEEIGLPDTLRGVITARVDRLDGDLKQLLRTAAVVGRSFHERVLQEVLDDGELVRPQLEALEEAELVRQRQHDAERSWAFKHAITHEAIYDSILLRQRRELHRRVAEVLERVFAERVDDVLGLLAYHYAHAEDWQRAQDYLFRAGDQAGRIAADAEALTYYKQALAAYGRAFGAEWDPLQRAELDRKMGEAFFRRNAHEEADAYLQRALAALASPLPQTRSQMRLAVARETAAQVAHRMLPQALVRRGEADAVVRERCRIYEILRWIDYFRDQRRLLLGDLLELNLAERAGYAPGIACASFALGVICDLIPAHRLARRYHLRAVALAESLGHPILIGESHLGLQLHEQYGRGDWAAAVAHGERATAAFLEAGYVRGWGAVNGGLAWGLALRGEIAHALELAQDVAQTGEDAADKQVQAWGVGAWGIALASGGALQEGITRVRESIELFAAVPDYLAVAAGHATLAQLQLWAGELDEALEAAEFAHDLMVARKLRGFMCTFVMRSRAEALVAAASRASGRDRRDLLRRSDVATRVVLEQVKLNRALATAAYHLRGSYEWQRGHPRRAERWWRRAVATGEQLGLQVDLANCLADVGRLSGDAAARARGRGIETELARRLGLAIAPAGVVEPDGTKTRV